MSITLITEPKKAIDGTSEYSYFNAVNNPILFEFQRKDFTSITIADNGSGYVRVTISDTTGMTSGDYIYLYSTVYTSGTYEATVIDGTHFDLLDLVYSAGAGGGDFVNSNTIRPFYYLNVVVTVDSADYTIQCVPDETGLIRCDVHGVIQPLLNRDNDNDYTSFYFENTNQCKIFTIKYTEFWSGSAQSPTSRAVDYFAVSASRHVGEDPNLIDYYYIVDAGRTFEPKFLTYFKKPVIFHAYPFTLSFLGKFTGSSYFDYKCYNKNKSYVGGANGSPSTASYEGLFESKFLDSVLFWTLYYPTTKFFVFTITESSVETQALWCDYIREKQCNTIYLSWLNDLGGREFYLFTYKSWDVQSENPVVALRDNDSTLNQSIKEYSIPATSEKVIRLFEDNIPIENLDGWLDFLRKENVLMLKHKFWADNLTVSDKGSGVVTVTCDEPHHLLTGDQVKFYGTAYGSEYSVTVKTDYIFEFTATYYGVAPTSIWRKVLSSSDWINCRITNRVQPIIESSRFSIGFDLIIPSYTRPL